MSGSDPIELTCPLEEGPGVLEYFFFFFLDLFGFLSLVGPVCYCNVISPNTL